MKLILKPVLLQNQVLVLKIRVFQQDTANEIKRLIEEYSSTKLAHGCAGFTHNPGGLLSAAVESADLFESGTHCHHKSRSEGDQQFQALPSNEFQSIKTGDFDQPPFCISGWKCLPQPRKEHKRA